MSPPLSTAQRRRFHRAALALPLFFLGSLSGSTVLCPTPADYRSETFGSPAPPPAPPFVVPPGSGREEVFRILLKALRDNGIETSRRRADRLRSSGKSADWATLGYLEGFLGGPNAANPVSRMAHTHFGSPEGRQEFLSSLGNNNRKRR